MDVNDLSLERPGRLGTFYLEDHHPPRPSCAVYDRSGTAFQALTAADRNPGGLNGRAALHVSGINLALGGGVRALTLALIKSAREQGVLVSFDVNHRRLLLTDTDAPDIYAGAARHADLIFVAARDVGLLSDSDGLRTINPHTLIVVTRGAQGSEAYSPNAPQVIQAALPVAGPGRIGRGDAYAAGFLHAHLGGATPGEALHFASGCAALKTTLPGAQLRVSEAGWLARNWSEPRR